MDRSTGVRILAAIDSLRPGLGELDLAVKELADEGERNAFIKTLGDTLFYGSYELTMHVVRQHPDLDPDGDRFKR
jgi:precorrin-2 methylase